MPLKNKVVNTKKQCKDRLSAHQAMLKVLERDADKALDRLAEEILTLKSAALEILKNNNKVLSILDNEKQRKINKHLDKMAYIQKKIVSHSDDKDLKFLRLYKRYLKMMVKIEGLVQSK